MNEVCDICSAPAVLRVLTVSGALFLCRYDAIRHRNRLVAQGCGAFPISVRKSWS